MPYGLIIEFQGEFDPSAYDAVNGKLGIDMDSGTGDWPKGLLSHAGGTTSNGFAVLEVWSSKEEQETFMQTRLGAALEASGVPQPDRIEWVELLGFQAPG
jgi:hypothetical protein